MDIIKNLKEDLKELTYTLNTLESDLIDLENLIKEKDSKIKELQNKKEEVKDKDWYEKAMQESLKKLTKDISQADNLTVDDIILFMTAFKDNDLEMIDHLTKKLNIETNYTSLMREYYGN